MDDFIADFYDRAVNTATRDDTIATPQILQHLAGFALLLLLWANEQEIEDREHCDERNQHVDLPEDPSTASRRSS
jgi:hypothetical protein